MQTQTVPGLGASQALSSILAQDQSQTSPVQTSSALASQSASQALSATVQTLFSSTIAAMSSSSSQAALLSLTETRDTDKPDEKKAKQEEKSEKTGKSEKTEKAGKVVLSEKRDAVVQYASGQVVQIIQQNRPQILPKLLKMSTPSGLAVETAAALVLCKDLSPEENAVSSWVAKHVDQQLNEYFTGTHVQPKIKLLANLLVLPKAKELCARIKEISADWVDNLVLDTKAGSVV